MKSNDRGLHYLDYELHKLKKLSIIQNVKFKSSQHKVCKFCSVLNYRRRSLFQAFKAIVVPW